MTNKLAKKYIRRVSLKMPIIGARKKQFLATLRDEVDEYLAENPQADYPQLEARFGTPEDISADFIVQMPSWEINRRFRIRNRIIAIFAVIALLIAIIWSALMVYLIAAEKKTEDRYYVVSPIETFYPEATVQ